MDQLEVEVIRAGLPQPSPKRRQLRAGPLIVTLEEGALRSFRLLQYPHYEVLRGIYAAVRDHNWGTIAPCFLSYDVEAREDTFQVRFLAEHITAEIDFVWQGTISGSSAGEIVFTFDGQARRAFRKNRIGFCVLHPMEFAGTALEVETPAGTLHSVFPVSISPHQPFKEITAMRYSSAPSPSDGSEIRMELRLSGELFEMEDQRNWTDASYKTYCTPLHLPYPVELAAGERIVQSIALRPLSYPALPTSPALCATEKLSVEVSAESTGPLPALGFGLARHTTPFSPAEIAHLRALQPAYLWVELDLARPDWKDTLDRAWNDASLLRTELELSVVCDDEGQELAPLFWQLAGQQIAIARLCCFSRSTHVTTRAMLEQATGCRATAGLIMQLGAGSRANFAEFNRADLPLDLAELANYPINPQVHAFDHLSLVETLPAQAVTASNAQRIASGLPLNVGPVTLKPRFNAAATASEELAEQDASVDPRQMSLFAAGWTVGSLRHLASARTRWLAYYETTGARGLLEQAKIDRPRGQFPHLPGALFPLYHVFADVAEFRQGKLLAVKISATSTIEALAMRQDQRLLLLLANVTGERQSLLLHLPHATELRARTLDETTAIKAMYDPAHFRHSSEPLLPTWTEQVAIDLLPFAVMRIEGQLEVM
jgi:D-apionolactonase